MTLGFFDYPVALVEFAIALSIFVLAVELTRDGEARCAVAQSLVAGGGLRPAARDGFRRCAG